MNEGDGMRDRAALMEGEGAGGLGTLWSQMER